MGNGFAALGRAPGVLDGGTKRLGLGVVAVIGYPLRLGH